MGLLLRIPTKYWLNILNTFGSWSSLFNWSILLLLFKIVRRQLQFMDSKSSNYYQLHFFTYSMSLWNRLILWIFIFTTSHSSSFAVSNLLHILLYTFYPNWHSLNHSHKYSLGCQESQVLRNTFKYTHSLSLSFSFINTPPFSLHLFLLLNSHTKSLVLHQQYKHSLQSSSLTHVGTYPISPRPIHSNCLTHPSQCDQDIF